MEKWILEIWAEIRKISENFTKISENFSKKSPWSVNRTRTPFNKRVSELRGDRESPSVLNLLNELRSAWGRTIYRICQLRAAFYTVFNLDILQFLHLKYQKKTPYPRVEPATLGLQDEHSNDLAMSDMKAAPQYWDKYLSLFL